MIGFVYHRGEFERQHLANWRFQDESLAVANNRSKNRGNRSEVGLDLPGTKAVE